jgi:hypothetical protein
MTFFFDVDHRENSDSIKIKIGLDLQNVASLGAVSQQR